jgi:DNA-binding transcriptional LysR family regulator
VKLGCAPSLVRRLVPQALERFLQEMPETRIIVEPRPSRIVVEMLSSHHLELGLLFLPIDHPGLEVTPLRSFSTVCVLHRSHPLAATTALTPQELSGERLILLARSDPARFAIDHAFRSARKAQKIAAETPNVALAVTLAARGLGIAIVNELMARDMSAPETVIVPFRPELRHQMALLRPTSLELSTEAARLAECLTDAVEAMPCS